MCAAAARAQSLLPAEPVRLDSLSAFRPTAANWSIAGGIGGDPRADKTLTPLEGTGILVNNATPEARGQLFTTWEHGDLELDLDFLLLPGADSGIYLQGRYEVQIRDSWGKTAMTWDENGAVYQSSDPSKPPGERAVGGSAPKANASRAPGLWQHVQIAFEAPRFDAEGRKTRNARIVRVVLNGYTVQENVEVPFPTRGAAFTDEKPVGPLMIQGNNLAPGHAVKNIAVKRYGPETVKVADVRYKLYQGEFRRVGEYDTATVTSEGALDRFSQAAVEKSGRFGLMFTGTLDVPKDGLYAFTVETPGATRLAIDGRDVVVPLERGGQPGTVMLKAGTHTFRADMLQTGSGRPSFEVLVEGPGIASHAITAPDSRPTLGGRGGGAGGAPGAGRGPRQILVEPKDRVLAQRSFVPFEPRKRLYGINVGTPAGVHYSYDFETGAILRVWRGGFLDTFEMWDARGEPQLAKPVGPSVTFSGKPGVALIELARNGNWPETPDAMWSSQGYTLEPDGLPVFLSSLADLKIRDRIAPSADGRGLTRTLEARGELSSWSTWVLLAEADQITPQPDGKGWIIGDREWFLDWPADAQVAPVLRQRDGRALLAVPITRASLEKPITYTLVW